MSSKGMMVAPNLGKASMSPRIRKMAPLATTIIKNLNPILLAPLLHPPLQLMLQKLAKLKSGPLLMALLRSTAPNARLHSGAVALRLTPPVSTAAVVENPQ
jgi:hypothetical protein